MKQLRVKAVFRDERNFFTIHQKGDMIVVDDNRAARLIECGLCEGIEKKVKAESSDTSELKEPQTEPKAEAPKRTYTRKKK